MAKKNGKPSHISHRQHRVAGKFAKTSQPSQQLIAAPPLPIEVQREAVPHPATFASQILSINGKRVYYNPDEAVRQSRIEADKMLSDPAVRSALHERFRSTVLAEWSIEPENAEDSTQSDMAKALTKIVQRIDGLEDLFNWLMYAVFHGRAAVNSVFRRGHDELGTWVGVSEWQPIHGDKLIFTSEKGQAGIKVGVMTPEWLTPIDVTFEGRAYFLDKVTRPTLCIHKGEVMDGLFEDVYSAGAVNGVGIRSMVYWPWWLKQNAVGWLLDGLERWGQGTTIWFYQAGNPDSEKAVRKAAEAQSNQNNLIFPRASGDDKGGAGIERLEMSDGGGIEHIEHILRDYFDAQIKALIISQELSSTTGKSGTGMNSGVADFQSHTKSELIKFDAIRLGRTLTNELLKPIARFNWPDLPFRCKFKFAVDDSERKELLAGIKILFDMGGEVSEDQVRSLLGLAKPKEGERTLRKQAPPALDQTGQKPPAKNGEEDEDRDDSEQ
jgi:phage gp29-like protein